VSGWVRDLSENFGGRVAMIAPSSGGDDMVARIAIDDFSWQRRVGIATFVTLAPYGAIRSGLAGSVVFGRRSAFASFSETSFFNRQMSKSGGSLT
jgi:hypothetical protein